MKNNRYFKRFLVTFLPFLRSFFIANTIGDLFYFLAPKGRENFLNRLFFSIWFPDSGTSVLHDLLNALFVWFFFYLAIAVIFKKKERFERLCDVSRIFLFTAVFGVVLLFLSFYGVGSYGNRGLVNVKLLLGFIYAFPFFFIFIPLAIVEMVALGKLLNKTKSYGWLKSQCISFFMFLFLPLFLTRVVNWLFVVIFWTKH